jgi:hypothetical protein
MDTLFAVAYCVLGSPAVAESVKLCCQGMLCVQFLGDIIFVNADSYC